MDKINDYYSDKLSELFLDQNFEKILFISVPQKRILLVEHRIEGVIGQLYVLYSFDLRTESLHKLGAFYSDIEVITSDKDTLLLKEAPDPSLPFPCDERHYIYDLEQDTLIRDIHR